MANAVPAAVRAADLARYAMRASQLEKAKPVISYYCNYWVVNQILEKNIHDADEECLNYATNMMEKLEEFKSDNQENDALKDDVVAKAYVEQFGLETFARAENTLRANKVSRQTADTFSAAATFLDLLQIWGEIEPEQTAKIRYAKYHALRIAKALRAGEDPNASNPAPQEYVADETLPPLDPNDAEVQLLIGPPQSRQPSVVDVPDEGETIRSKEPYQPAPDQSLHPSRASSNVRPPAAHGDRQLEPPTPDDEVSPVEASNAAEDFYNQSSQYDVSPLGPDPPPPGRRSSVGGNYFPQVSTPAPQVQSDANPLSLPSAPVEMASGPPGLPFAPSPKPISPSPSVSAPTNASDPKPQSFSPPPAPAPAPSTTLNPSHFQAPPQRPQRQPQPQAYAYPSSNPRPQAPPPPAIDEAAIAAAQKHARWAISALNFDDVPTAIREFRSALERLGG